MKKVPGCARQQGVELLPAGGPESEGGYQGVENDSPGGGALVVDSAGQAVEGEQCETAHQGQGHLDGSGAYGRVGERHQGQVVALVAAQVKAQSVGQGGCLLQEAAGQVKEKRQAGGIALGVNGEGRHQRRVMAHKVTGILDGAADGKDAAGAG